MKSKKGKHIANTIAVLSVFLLMAFQNITSNSQVVIKLDVILEPVPYQYFMSKKNVEDLINRQYDSLLSTPLKEINISMLEDSIEQIPYVEKAEVYSTLDGRLTAVVKQNTAIARVHKGNIEFYLDANGETMPLSSQYSTMVPRITGNIDSVNLNTTHQFLMHTLNDPFYESFFSGIDYKKNNLILYPKNGQYTITFGTSSEMKIKLEKFKIFYQSTITEENLKTIDRVSLIYKDQVVYSKK